MFVNLCHIVVPIGKTANLKSRSILTKYSNRLTDKPLSKHSRVNLDLDGLQKPRNPRMTQRFNQRVSILSLCCYHRQETFVNLGLFETINYSSFLCLCLVTAFYSISFLSASHLISKKYVTDIVKKQAKISMAYKSQENHG